MLFGYCGDFGVMLWEMWLRWWGWEGVDDFGGFDGGVGDAFDHGDDVVAGFFEPLVGVVDDAAGFVGFDVVAVENSFEGCATVWLSIGAEELRSKKREPILDGFHVSAGFCQPKSICAGENPIRYCFIRLTQQLNHCVSER